MNTYATNFAIAIPKLANIAARIALVEPDAMAGGYVILTPSAS